MPIIDHVALLRRAVQAEWTDAKSGNRIPSLLADHRIRSNFNLHEVVDKDSTRAYSWCVSPLYNCLVVAVSAEVKVREDLRNKGIGKFMRGFRTRALRRAGFRTEICTVRADNVYQTKIMEQSGALEVCEFPSDRGGVLRMWQTDLPAWDGVAIPDEIVEETVPLNVAPERLASRPSSLLERLGAIPTEQVVHYVSDIVPNQRWTVRPQSVTCRECAIAARESTVTYYQWEPRNQPFPGVRQLWWIPAETTDAAIRFAQNFAPHLLNGNFYRPAQLAHDTADHERVMLFDTSGQVREIREIAASTPGGF